MNILQETLGNGMGYVLSIDDSSHNGQKAVELGCKFSIRVTYSQLLKGAGILLLIFLLFVFIKWMK